MTLQFIGTHGSMGLQTGRTYECSIQTRYNHIWVTWSDSDWGPGSCPYSSLEALASNWKNV